MVDMSHAANFAFAYVSPAINNPSLTIQCALPTHLPWLHFQQLPSSHGTVLIRFNSPADRERADTHPTPLEAVGHIVTLECHEESSVHFFHDIDYLAEFLLTN